MYLADLLAEYKGELDKKFGVDAVKVLILKNAILWYPVIADRITKITSPIALMAYNSWDIEEIFSELQVFGKSKIYCTSLPASRIRSLQEDLIMTKYINHRNSLEGIQILQENMQEEKYVLPIIAFVGNIPKVVLPYISGGIYINNVKKSETLLGEKVFRKIITCCTDNMDVALKVIDSVFDSELYSVTKAGEFSAIAASEKILEAIARMIGDKSIREKVLHELATSLSEMKEAWNDCLINAEWTDAFRHILLRSASSQPGILNRNHVLEDEIDKVETWPLYDQNFYYLSDSLFSDICKALQDCISLLSLKQALVEEETIVGEGCQRNYWCVKVPVITENGPILRPRKIRIRRSKIDLYGELSWQERIQGGGIIKNV